MVSRLWLWVRHHPIVVFVVVFSGLNAAGWQALEAERAARERDRCDTAVDTRTEQEAMWVGILDELGADAATIDALHDGYANLPTPAGC
jgi:hypothetical protein